MRRGKAAERRGHRAIDEAQAWRVGQVVSAEAALRLLIGRATAAKEKAQPWPEFAEYDCYACHHGLQGPSWRQKRGYAGRVPGSLRWNDWSRCATRN